MKKKEKVGLPRWFVLIFMLLGLVYVGWEFYSRSKTSTSMASLLTLIAVFAVCISGLIMYFPSKRKGK